MAISKTLRAAVLRRDNFTCQYCGGRAPEVRLTIDHVTPVTLGGQDVPENLVAACADCNAGKAATPPGAAVVAGVAQDALRWAAAIKTVVAAASEERQRADEYCDAFHAMWLALDLNREPLPTAWRASIIRFRSLGLPIHDLLDYITMAADRNLCPGQIFRYVCGCAWRRIAEIQEAARAVLATEEADGCPS
jgi:hypothetical protein